MHRIEQSARLLTVGGVETYLAFIQGVELRHFCAFDVFRDEAAVAELEASFLAPTADAALASGHDLLIDALVWRAHGDYVRALGHGPRGVEAVNRHAVERVRRFAERWRSTTPGSERIGMFINGDIGPRGDGYRVEAVGPGDALDYHRRQVRVLAELGVDVVSALTMTHADEAIGIALAAAEAGLPVIISPTVETDGRTPEGQALGELIERVDDATGGGPLFYMVNCAHPTHLEPVLREAADRGEAWLPRMSGLRANASTKSHAELDDSEVLDRGAPRELAGQLARLRREFGWRLVGGCCGTDAEHIRCIAHAVAEDAPQDGHARGADTPWRASAR
ncbi:MAG: homocysteine S-methyltransferase family protein [Sandaracinaceae bacterium]